MIHLRFIQIYHQVYYKLRNKLIKPHKFASLEGYAVVKNNLSFQAYAFDFTPDSTSATVKESGGIEFTFLNLPCVFDLEKVDWNHANNGKLWTYNLNYFDFLLLDNISVDHKTQLLSAYCRQSIELQDGLEPYPISLRGMNWIKFFAQSQLLDGKMNEVLYSHYKVLMANVEYHIMANHLIENGFSLLFASYYFQDETFYQKAKSILKAELQEQILSDGAHFERSPMYHQIILYRVLDCINLISNNGWKNEDLLSLFKSKATSMLYWINQVSFSNGEIPMVQDSAFGIAPSTEWLNAYAGELGIEPSKKIKNLGASGYRKFKVKGLELFVDAGSVSPTYQPGHAHADEGNFVLYANGTPVIVDVGLSTYEKNEKRQIERSTVSHNCVNINNDNSSEVWGGFRVARRAKVQLKVDTTNEVEIEHDGYRSLGVSISRNCRLGHDSILISDTIRGANESTKGELRLHVHPDITPRFDEGGILLGTVYINIEGFHEVAEESYMFAGGFNKSIEASLLRLQLKSESTLTIKEC